MDAALVKVLESPQGPQASVKRLDAVLDQVYLRSWCFIVVRHGGKACRDVNCLLALRRVAPIYIQSSINTFSRPH